MRGSGVSKKTEGSVSYPSVAASLRNSSSLGNGDTLLPKSTSVRGQDYPTTDSVRPADSIVAPEIISADLLRVVDTFSNIDDDTDDSPTEGFSSISEAIEDIRQGKVSMPYNSAFHGLSATVNLSNKICCYHLVFS